MSEGKIYCFINQINSLGYIVTAYAEDGTHLAGHASSNLAWAKHDIGITSNWKHEKYKAKYPEGYELIWLVEEDPRFKPIIEMINNKEKPNE
jgi:hypothetical protein